MGWRKEVQERSEARWASADPGSPSRRRAVDSTSAAAFLVGALGQAWMERMLGQRLSLWRDKALPADPAQTELLDLVFAPGQDCDACGLSHPELVRAWLEAAAGAVAAFQYNGTAAPEEPAGPLRHQQMREALLPLTQAGGDGPRVLFLRWRAGAASASRQEEADALYNSRDAGARHYDELCEVRRQLDRQTAELAELRYENEQLGLRDLQHSEDVEAWKRASQTAIHDKEQAISALRQTAEGLPGVWVDDELSVTEHQRRMARCAAYPDALADSVQSARTTGLTREALICWRHRAAGQAPPVAQATRQAGGPSAGQTSSQVERAAQAEERAMLVERQMSEAIKATNGRANAEKAMKRRPSMEWLTTAADPPPHSNGTAAQEAAELERVVAETAATQRALESDERDLQGFLASNALRIRQVQPPANQTPEDQINGMVADLPYVRSPVPGAGETRPEAGSNQTVLDSRSISSWAEENIRAQLEEHMRAEEEMAGPSAKTTQTVNAKIKVRPKAANMRAQLEGAVSSMARDNIKAGLVRAQLNGSGVSGETLASIKDGLARTAGSSDSSDILTEALSQKELAQLEGEPLGSPTSITRTKLERLRQSSKDKGETGSTMRKTLLDSSAMRQAFLNKAKEKYGHAF